MGQTHDFQLSIVFSILKIKFKMKKKPIHLVLFFVILLAQKNHDNYVELPNCNLNLR